MPQDPTHHNTLADRLTEKELARHWRCSPRTLQRMRKQGCGPAWIRIGSRILYTRSDILDYEEWSKHGGDVA